ncbi:hypothetical protein FJZ36_04355 [Candidatus Poribacteria bacterium]|nr:hypothetical protein [Candidatus Poribacteria bacterium]
MRHATIPLGILLCVVSWGASARVELTPVPQRQSLTISADASGIAFVREVRAITISPGRNRIEISFANMQVDTRTVHLDAADRTDEFSVFALTVPPSAPQTLVVEADSETAGELPIELTYRVGGISAQARYIAVVSKDERTLSFRASLLIANDTGEDYENAEWMLPLGTKARLTVRRGERVEVPAASYADVPIAKTYVVSDPLVESPTVTARYGLRLGNGSALPSGKVRIVRESESHQLELIGEAALPLTPAGKEIELGVGKAQDIEVKSRFDQRDRTDIRRNRAGAIVLFDTLESLALEVINRKKEPAEVRLTLRPNGEWTTDAPLTLLTRRDAATSEVSLRVAASGTESVKLDFRGTNRQQGWALER